MSVDMFDTRTMLEALEQMKPPKTFLLDTFFPTVEVSPTKYVDIDIVKGKRRLAPFVSPLHEGKIVDHRGFTTNTYEPPYVKPKMVTTAADLLHRPAGEPVYGQSMQERTQDQLGRDLAELDQQITRREEWMAAQALQTGKIVVSGEGIEAEIDFSYEATHLLTLGGAELWNDASCEPLELIRGWRRRILKDSGLAATDIVMGTSAIEEFLANDQVRRTLDNRRIEIGEIDPDSLPNGATYYGRIKDAGLDIWCYDEWYVDEDTEIETPMIDPKRVVMGCRQARTARHYGAIQDVAFQEETGELAAFRRFPKAWTEKDPPVQLVMLQSAPLVALHQVDAFLSAKVLS